MLSVFLNLDSDIDASAAQNNLLNTVLVAIDVQVLTSTKDHH